MADIYELIEAGRASGSRPHRVAAAILDNLNDRRGIKQELQACDDDVIAEIFDTVANLVQDTP